MFDALIVLKRTVIISCYIALNAGGSKKTTVFLPFVTNIVSLIYFIFADI